MPRATIDDSYGDKIFLESLDEGYITVRPLPYGEKLKKQEKAMRMMMRSSENGSDDTEFEAEFASRTTRFIEFKYCIGDHNLTDANERKLDFSDIRTLDKLDPRVGTEIEKHLDAINGEEVDEELFISSPSSVSEVEAKSLSSTE